MFWLIKADQGHIKPCFGLFQDTYQALVLWLALCRALCLCIATIKLPFHFCIKESIRIVLSAWRGGGCTEMGGTERWGC